MTHEVASSGRAAGLVTLCLVASCMTGPVHRVPEPAVSNEDEDLFAAKIAPMLAERCQPCHFPGGVMYDRLPFDRPETVRTLGSKLFSRIRDEEERQWIRDFLAEDLDDAGSSPGRRTRS